jgi:predicted 2-oxoglutarate/Fe(II)-dependent dioxygenase YbiX
MPRPPFFTRLGLLIIPDFLSPDDCARLRSEADNSRVTDAEIVRSRSVIDKTKRSTKVGELAPESEILLNQRLAGLHKQAASHFKIDLNGHQDPQLLIYGVGDRYRPHQDAYSGQDVPHYLERRRISIVIFLNSWCETANEGGYCGGALTLFGLISSAREKDFGFPLFGEEGTLVAFPSDVFHEVEEITYGTRYSIVSWLY